MRRISDFNSLDQEQAAEVNISPLIDMMFLLLIFFVVTATFTRETGIEVDRPQAVTAETLEKTTVMIGIDSENRVFIDGQEINGADSGTIISAMCGNDNRPILIIADEKSSSGKVIEVLDSCRESGAENVSVATETAE